MALLRREVLQPVRPLHRPQTLAGVLFATLLFATSLDAMLLSYRLRVAELDRNVPSPTQTRAVDDLGTRVDAYQRDRLRLQLELAQRGVRGGDFPAPVPSPGTSVGCDSSDPLCCR